MTNNKFILAIFGLLLCSLFYLSITPVYAKTTYTTETDELLKNPGKGWMTMFKPAISDSNLPDDIPSTLYYVRINWEQVHTGPDQYNWGPLDSAIENAMRGGQQVMIRLMPIWSGGSSPDWMRQQGFNGYSCEGGWSADLDDPNVQRHISKLLFEMGKRYDKDPGVHSIEINFFGVYGEGHYYECPNHPMPSRDTQAWLVDEHYTNFPTPPIIGPIHAQEEEQYATIYMYQQYGNTRGAGVFFDCWGDNSHTNSKYGAWLERITGSFNPDIWEKGIMKLEPCGVMNDWGSNNVRKALQWALDNHASFIGNKDSQIPSDVKQDVKETLKRLGYRLVLRKAEHPERIKAGNTLDATLTFENIGVAPPYNDYYLAAQIRNSSGDAVKTYISNISVKFWLPGNHVKTLSTPVPLDLANGTYHLAIGIVSLYDNKPAIKMPIQGRESSGWHPVSSFLIDSSTPTPKPKPPTGLEIVDNN